MHLPLPPSTIKHTHTHTHALTHTHSRYAHEGQHGGGPAPTDPHGEEDDEQRGGEHHLARVGRRVPDGEGKGHGPAQTWELGRERKGTDGAACYIHADE